MMDDVMARLRDADPARRAELESVDAAALAAMRQAITTMGTTTARPAVLRRRLGRGGMALGIAGLLVGGGVAYAAVSGLLGGGEIQNISSPYCMTVWGENQDAVTGPA